MILFTCTQCGKGLSSADDNAGRNAVCPYCSQRTPIPEQSDPDCRLVFNSGAPDGGIVLTNAQLQAAIAKGEFTTDDLIYDGGRWCPLGHVLSLPPMPPPPPPSADEPEIALHFSDLPPVQLDAGSSAPTTAAKTRRPSGQTFDKLTKTLTTILIVIVAIIIAIIGCAIAMGLTAKQ